MNALYAAAAVFVALIIISWLSPRPRSRTTARDDAHPRNSPPSASSPSTSTLSPGTEAAGAASLTGDHSEGKTMHVTISVNGRRYEREVEPRLLLVHFIRDLGGMTGTKVGCDTSQCGSCTVLLDGMSVKSCTCLAVQADGSEVTTIEGLANAEVLHPLQDAFWEKHGLQCGFCTPGMVFASHELLAHTPTPTDDEIRHGLEGNVCRCTGYQNIVRAVRHASEQMAQPADS